MIQILSVIIIYSSYGIINHYNTKTEEVEGTSLSFMFTRSDEDVYLTLDEVKNFYDMIMPVIGNKLDYFFFMSWNTVNDMRMSIECAVAYSDGKYDIAKLYESNRGFITEGDMFSKDQLNSGEYVFVGCNTLFGIDDIISISGNDYKCVGIFSGDIPEDMIYVPYDVYPYTESINHTSFYLTKPLLESEYNYVHEAVENCFGDKLIIPEFDGIRNESDYRA